MARLTTRLVRLEKAAGLASGTRCAVCKGAGLVSMVVRFSTEPGADDPPPGCACCGRISDLATVKIIGVDAAFDVAAAFPPARAAGGQEVQETTP